MNQRSLSSLVALVLLFFLLAPLVPNCHVSPVKAQGNPVGYELLDEGKVLQIWNEHDSYYFNTTSGVQFSNHYQEYWSRNILIIGYYAGETWHRLYATDELTGFNRNLETDNTTYINVTLWKDLTYLSYVFRLAIRYHLKADDFKLTVQPYVKNLGIAINLDIGFAWKINNIQVKNNVENDELHINGTSYFLNQTLDLLYKDMTQNMYDENGTFVYALPVPYYRIIDFRNGTSHELFMQWDENLTYVVQVKSEPLQYNAPTTLAIKVGHLSHNEEKTTLFYWKDDGWVSPTGYEDPDSGWSNEANAYDDNEATYACSNPMLLLSWSKFLILTHVALTSNKVRFLVTTYRTYAKQIDLDVFKDGVWVDVYQGEFTNDVWVEKTFTQGSVTKARMRFYNGHTTESVTAYVKEFDFWEVSAAGYALKLCVKDWDLTDAISGATVTMNNGSNNVKTSNGNGWANYTSVSGTVTVSVTYYNNNVNGTSITVSADTTKNLKCKLYDAIITAKTDNNHGIISGTNVTCFNDTGTQNGKIKSGITVDTTGQVTLTNIPNATLRFIMYAKSDYSQIIANTTQLISSDDYSFNIVGNQNYATATLSFALDAIIWMSSPSFLFLLTLAFVMVHKKLKKINRG